MVNDYKKIDLFGKTFIQKVDLKPPFEYAFPVTEQACFLYMLKCQMEYQAEDDALKIPTHHSLLLNCLNSGKQIRDTNSNSDGEIVIVTFHPDILRRVYDKEIPLIFTSNNQITNQSRGGINNDFLIHKYIEGLLFILKILLW